MFHNLAGTYQTLSRPNMRAEKTSRKEEFQPTKNNILGALLYKRALHNIKVSALLHKNKTQKTLLSSEANLTLILKNICVKSELDTY